MISTGATSVVKDSNEEKYEYSSYGITFDGRGFWSFDNGTARNVTNFAVDNSSSYHANNRKNNILMLVKVQRLELMEALAQQRKILVLILVKETQNFAWACIITLIIVICLLMEKKSLSLKPTAKTFRLTFVSETYLMDLVLLNLEKYL